MGQIFCCKKFAHPCSRVLEEPRRLAVSPASRFPLGALGLKRRGGEGVLEAPPPDGPGVQGPDGDRAHGGLLADPGHHPVHGHRLLQQGRLHVHVRRPDAGGRGGRQQAVPRQGRPLLRVPRKHVSVAGDGVVVLQLLSERRLLENVTRVGGFAGRLAFLGGRFEGRQLEDVTAERAGWAGLKALPGGITGLQPQPVVLLSDLHGSLGTLQPVYVGRPLQVC